MAPQAWLAFDLGGVLFDVDIARYPEAMARYFSIPEHALSAATFASGHWQAAEIGSLSADDFSAAVLKDLGLKTMPKQRQQWQECWSSVLRIRPGVIDMLKHVKVPLAIWSNTDPVHAITLRRMLDEASAHWCLSCELGVEKPDPSFYEKALAQMPASAASVYYLDDRADNVAAARAQGIHAQEIAAIDPIKEQLKNWGFLPAP